MIRSALIIIGAVFVLGAAALVVALRSSMAVLDGEQRLAGLEAEVTVTRDALGIPTLSGRTRVDVARASGFVHAQDRFFQMDLLRRVAAGELAELFGTAALDHDRRRRVHGLRRVADQVVARMAPDERAVVDAYVDGVNAGLAALGVRPPEYLLLRSSPRPWRPADTVLAVHTMFLRLGDPEALYEMRKGLLYECLPAPVADFVTATDGEWTAPIDGGTFARVPTPGPEALDLRTAGALDFDVGRSVAESLAADPDFPVGSNAWVVGGASTAHGRALVASDMHLGLSLPHIWYRMRVVAGEVDVSGVTLPGTPTIVAGSNGHVAWGFTNSYGDWSDRVLVRADPGDPDRYLTPAGSRPFTTREERIAVARGDEVVYHVRETIWGPVVDDPLGRPTALRWLGHRPAATNLRLLAFERARSVDELIALAPGLGIPPQNLNVGDSAGRVGWTIAGRIPARRRYDSTRPSDGAHDLQGWDGWLDPAAYPRVVDPPDGLIWTANSQVVTGAALARLGDSGYAHGARAKQVRDALRALDAAKPADMLAIQLDDRALLLARWKTLLGEVLDRAGPTLHPRAAEFAAALGSGNPRAAASSVDFRLVWSFRTRLRDVVFAALTARCRALVPDYRFAGVRQDEGALWRLVTERPLHLLHPGHRDWDALLAHVANEIIEHLDAEFEGPFTARTWGEHNVLEMRHPLSRAVPALAPMLDIGPTPVSGARHLPMVLQFDQGASERFGVAPGDEAAGYLHMPGGQSGHPLSRFYRAGHQAWLDGEPTPFLPGATVHSLRLVPDPGTR